MSFVRRPVAKRMFVVEKRKNTFHYQTPSLDHLCRHLNNSCTETNTGEC